MATSHGAGTLQGPHAGVLHNIGNGVSAFEPANSQIEAQSIATDTLIFIGGLSDRYFSVPYVYLLAKQLPKNWSLVQLSLTSSGSGWATSTLDQDVKEMHMAIAYLKDMRPAGRIVLMGHSTGCQDLMHYAMAIADGRDEYHRPDGLILQAPISDREAMLINMSRADYDKANAAAQSMMEAGKSDSCLDLSLTRDFMPDVPVSAQRWLSLASPDGNGVDDYFSSDASAEKLVRTFGRLGMALGSAPIRIIFCEEDEYLADHIDVIEMQCRWREAIQSRNGVFQKANLQPLAGASHNLASSPPHIVQALCNRVVDYLLGL